MGKNFRETLAEQMEDPAFKAEWDAQAPERQLMREVADGQLIHDDREVNGSEQKKRE